MQELADIWKSNRDIHFKPTCPLGRVKILIGNIADLYKRVSEGCFMNGETCKEKRKEKRRLYLEQKQFLTQECFFSFFLYCLWSRRFLAEARTRKRTSYARAQTFFYLQTCLPDLLTFSSLLFFWMLPSVRCRRRCFFSFKKETFVAKAASGRLCKH